MSDIVVTAITEHYLLWFTFVLFFLSPAYVQLDADRCTLIRFYYILNCVSEVWYVYFCLVWPFEELQFLVCTIFHPLNISFLLLCFSPFTDFNCMGTNNLLSSLSAATM